MENDKFFELSYIRDTMLENPFIDGITVWNAAKLALEDKYLRDLMIDWMKETNTYIKSEMLNEVINYTDEILRKLKAKNDNT